MKKLFSIMVVAAMVLIGANTTNAASAHAMGMSSTVEAQVVNTIIQDDGGEGTAEARGLHQEVKQRFIEGGPAFMGVVLLCLILGLAIAIERIIYLNLSTTNNKKLAEKVKEALDEGGVDAALEVCRNTKGPVASIY